MNTCIYYLAIMPFVFSYAFIHTGENMTTFVTRKGNQLILNNKVWRFAGMNMYWLGLDENCVPPQTGKCIAYPTHYRIDDALITAVAMGANVIRAHSLGVSSGHELSINHHKGLFNEKAFEPIDYAISQANVMGLRLIIPLTDNYNYYHGGYHDYVSFEGQKCNPFPKRVVKPGDSCRGFFDSKEPHGKDEINDFKEYINHLLQHVNQYSGLKYKDDPAILAWETGNELQIKGAPFTTWTEDIAAYIKETIGAKQLVMDGRDEVGTGVDNSALLDEPHVDIYTDHYYEDFVSAAGKTISDGQVTAKANKVFTVGEYGPRGNSNKSLGPFLYNILINNNVSGDCWWSLFPHGDNYGFVPHGDPYTLHFPGDSKQDRGTILLLREHAFAMRNLSVPSDTPQPTTPLIVSIQKGKIAWRGATLAVVYDVQQSTSKTGPWTTVCDRCATDNDTPWSPPHYQQNAYYRVRGYSLGGLASEWSEPVKSIDESSNEWLHPIKSID